MFFLYKSNIFRGRFGHFAFVVDNRIVVYGVNYNLKFRVINQVKFVLRQLC
jgi:hypothetical protein